MAQVSAASRAGWRAASLPRRFAEEPCVASAGTAAAVASSAVGGPAAGGTVAASEPGHPRAG